MTSPAESMAREPSRPTALEEARRLFREAEKLEAHHDTDRYAETLKRFLGHVEQHRQPLDEGATELAGKLEDAATAFYRLSQPEFALRAVEAGLSFAPGSSGLLHLKALIFLALNRNTEQTITLLDRALEGNPHDKRIWATKGDALKFAGRPKEAAAAYLSAQRLDAASSQYVDRALKLDPQNPVALRMKLQLARSGGGERQALEACEALLAAQPSDPELLLEKVRLLATLGELGPAHETLQKLLAQRPQDRHTRFLNARLLFAMERFDEAIPLYRALVEGSEPLDASALGEMATDLESGDRDPDLALATRRRLREVEPRNLANLQALRNLAIARDRLDLALEAARGILEASPHNLEALRSVVDLLIASGRTEEVMQMGREILEHHPNESADLKRVLAAAQSAGRNEAVRDLAHAVLRNAPDDLEARAALAGSLAQLGDKESALAIYSALAKEQPNEPSYLAEKKQLLVDLERLDELPDVLDELFRLDPSRYDVALERGHLNLSAAYQLAEGSAERERAARAALVSYERATLDPALRPASQLGIARAARLVHDNPRAVRAYREFLNEPANRKRADVLKELGHALREADRQTEAQDAYEQAVALGLEDADLFWGLVETLSRLNQEGKALRYVDLLLQREPGNPLFLRRKGQLLLKSGRRPEGLAVLKTAVQAAKGDPHVYFEIAEALRGQGNYADAVAYYGEGLKIDAKSRAGRQGLAETLLVAGRFNEVWPIVDALLHEDPNDLRAWKARADAHRALGHDPEVQYSLKAILLLDPHNSATLLEQYRLHLKNDQKVDAYSCLTQLLDSPGPEAESPGAWLEHGDLAAELGKAEESNRSYERALQLDPNRASEIVTRRARLRVTAGRPDLALEILDGTPPPDPTQAPERAAPYLLVRAEVLTALERTGDARTVYEQVRGIAPRSVDAALGLARCLLDEGKPTETRDLLRNFLPTVPPHENIYLLLSEAEAALGSLPSATDMVRKGVEVLPKAVPLWVRLGELNVRQEAWEKAADAYAHALALERENAELHLRAGFVAEKLGHSHDALSLYERATELVPGNKYAWSSRGLALLSMGRSDDARASFDRALALDSDFDAAKEGKKAALQRTREATIDRFGREALLLEAKLNRSVAKNDLFVTLHVPFDLLDPVLQVLSRSPRIDLERLSEEEMRDLEMASHHLITAAIEHRPAGIEERGLTLADVALLVPENYTLGQIQRLFGYLHSVLEADLRPENLRLTPDVEDLARRALLLPESDRTLFQLVRVLRVGVFKARLIKAVETAGRAVHAPLPALDLGAYTPEFRSAEGVGGRTATAPSFADPPSFVRSPPEPEFVPGAGFLPPVPPTVRPPPPEAPGAARCVGCGGLAAVLHSCGAPVCRNCIAQFHTCPKCGRVVTHEESTPLESVPVIRPAARERRLSAINPFRSLIGRGRTAPKGPETRAPPGGHRAAGGGLGSEDAEAPGRHDPRTAETRVPVKHPGGKESGGPSVPPPPGAAPPEETTTVRPPRPRPRADDEPRL